MSASTPPQNTHPDVLADAAAPIVSTLPCMHCNRPLDPQTIFARLCGYAASLKLFCAACPECGKSLEFQVHSGRLELGYTYSSGSPHFEGMVTVRLSGVRIARSAPDTIEYRGSTYRAPGESDQEPPVSR